MTPILHQVYQHTLASWLDKWQKRKAPDHPGLFLSTKIANKFEVIKDVHNLKQKMLSEKAQNVFTRV